MYGGNNPVIINLNYKNKILLKKNKKIYFFHDLSLVKPRIKVKLTHNLILVKLNNNTSIKLKKEKSIKIFIKENKIFIFSNSLCSLNNFTKRLIYFCCPNLFL